LFFPAKENLERIAEIDANSPVFAAGGHFKPERPWEISHGAFASVFEGEIPGRTGDFHNIETGFGKSPGQSLLGEIANMSDAKVPPAGAEQAGDEGLDVRGGKNANAVGFEVRGDVAEQLNGGGNVFDDIDQSNDIVRACDIRVRKNSEMDVESGVLGAFGEMVRGFDSFRLEAHFGGRFEEDSGGGTNIEKAVPLFVGEHRFNNLPGLEATLFTALVIGRVFEILVEFQDGIEIGALFKAAGAAFVNAASVAIAGVRDFEVIGANGITESGRLEKLPLGGPANPTWRNSTQIDGSIVDIRRS